MSRFSFLAIGVALVSLVLAMGYVSVPHPDRIRVYIDQSDDIGALIQSLPVSYP